MLQQRQGPRFRARGQNDQENRSHLLRDFLRGRYPDLQLGEIIRHVCAFACDRKGSKFIQLNLDEATDREKWFIFEEMRPTLLALMTDPFANYIVQKFIEVGSNEQREWILTLVEFNLMTLSTQKYGSRVVQSAIEYVSSLYQEHEIFKQFYGPDVVKLAKHVQGNHVVQFLFRSVVDQAQVWVKSYKHSLSIEITS